MPRDSRQIQASGSTPSPTTIQLWRRIEFHSRSFNPADRKKAAHTRELLSFVGVLKYLKPFPAGINFSFITDLCALAWLKASHEQSFLFQRWWAYISSFRFTNQYRPGKRIVTEDAMSRFSDLEHTTNPADMLSLPDPDEFGLPQPTGNAPASSLAAPCIAPSYDRPPIDHDGVLVLDADHAVTTLAPFPLDVILDEQLVTCAVLHSPATVASPSSSSSRSRWKIGVMSVMRYFKSFAVKASPSMTREQPLRTIRLVFSRGRPWTLPTKLL